MPVRYFAYRMVLSPADRDSRHAPTGYGLSSLQEPSSVEDSRHSFLDPRDPRPRLLRAGEVIQIA